MEHEVRLWREVLRQAIRDMDKPSCADKHERPACISKANNWFHTKDFETVCDLAMVEPGRLKTRLKYINR